MTGKIGTRSPKHWRQTIPFRKKVVNKHSQSRRLYLCQTEVLLPFAVCDTKKSFFALHVAARLLTKIIIERKKILQQQEQH